MFLTGGLSATAQSDGFKYSDERFADLQMLRYKVDGFESLTLKQKTFIYYLTEAALHGRDILFDQNGKYNLRIRKMLEAVYTDFKGDRNSDEFKAFEVYLKRVWFSNGIHHHYGCEKFDPEFSESFFRKAVASVDKSLLPLAEGQTVENLCDEICPVIFNPDVMQKRVNQADGEDLILTSACNYYEGVTQKEAEDFYNKMRVPNDHEPIMYGMNSRLVKTADGNIVEYAISLWGRTPDKWSMTYSEDGKSMLAAVHFHSDGTEEKIGYRYYDGIPCKPAEITFYDENGKRQERHWLSYDAAGNLVEVVIENNGKFSQETFINNGLRQKYSSPTYNEATSYEFDTIGNWTKQTENSDYGTSVKERQITYY